MKRCAGLDCERRTRRTFNQVGSTHLASAPSMNGDASIAEARNLLRLILLNFTNPGCNILQIRPLERTECSNVSVRSSPLKPQTAALYRQDASIPHRH